MAVANVIFFIMVPSLVSNFVVPTVARCSCLKHFASRSDLFNRQVGALISGWQDLIAIWQQSAAAVESEVSRAVSGATPANRQQSHRNGRACSSRTFLGVHHPQHVSDLGTHHHSGQFTERRDELRTVRWVGLAEVMGELMEHD